MTITKRKETLKWFLDNIAWFILLSMLIIFSFTVPGFAQWPIYRNILYHSVFVGILAIAQAICILSKEMDLSIESVLALSAVVTAYLAGIGLDASGLHLNAPTTLIIVLFMGAIIGLFNSYFIVKMKISSFIVTLAGYLIFRAVGLVITKGHGVVNISKDIVAIARTNIGPMPLMVIILIFMYLIFSLFLSKTQFGRYIYFVGDNRDASYNAGIKVDRVLTIVFVMSGILSALAGWLLAARTNGSSPSLGQGILFETMAAVVIGGVSLQGGVGKLSGVFAGALILSSISTVISIVGINPYYMNIIRGGMIIVAVLLDAIIRKVRPKLI
ncbi:MAG: ABC transporter permease [Atribacterota bacterium]